MKNLPLAAILTCAIMLASCGDTSTDSAASPKQLERVEEKLSADLSKMDTPEIIDFVDTEAKKLTALLETVTDGPSAEAALADIRSFVPRINASLKSLENLDLDNMTLNFGNARKMIKVAQSQVGLVNEVIRISEIPEARAVLEKELDKIEIINK